MNHRCKRPKLTNAELLDRALKTEKRAAREVGEVQIEWSEDPTEADLIDSIADVLLDVAQLDVYWDDVGYGAYEYGSMRGVDVRWVVELNEGVAFLGIPGAPVELPLPEVTVQHYGEGCDGEHSGRCRQQCAPWDLKVTWRPVYQERRGDALYVVYGA